MKPLPQLVEVFKFSAITGFIISATLIINLSHKTFTNLFKEKTATYYWLFLLMMIIPLLFIIFIFSLLFEDRDFAIRNLMKIIQAYFIRK